MPRWWNDLFWVSVFLVAAVLLMILAKPLMGLGEKRRPTHLVVLMSALIPASAVTAPAPAISRPAGHYGWSSIHCPIDHKPYTGRDLLQQT